MTQQDAIETAKVGITALVTACSGVLIAVLAFVAQADVLTDAQRYHAGFSAAGAGVGLWFAIATTLASYLNTGMMVLDLPKRWLWWTAMVLFCMGFASLTVSLCHMWFLVVA